MFGPAVGRSETTKFAPEVLERAPSRVDSRHSAPTAVGRRSGSTTLSVVPAPIVRNSFMETGGACTRSRRQLRLSTIIQRLPLGSSTQRSSVQASPSSQVLSVKQVFTFSWMQVYSILLPRMDNWNSTSTRFPARLITVVFFVFGIQVG